MWAGWIIQGWKADSEKLEAAQQALTEAAAQMASLQSAAFADHQKSMALEQRLAEADENREIQYVERQKVIEKPVYRDYRLDADGMRIAKERAAEIAATRQHAYPLP